jgi:hypothetical protein
LRRSWEAVKNIFEAGGKMAVEDLEQFKEWDEAASKFALRQMIFDQVKKDLPRTHILYRHAKSELEKAETHLADIESKW